jgi:biotin-independent malonate decarboxylase gamma subunit
VVGHALSGAFLTHGYQANRILAFDDHGVMIHAMHKKAAARVTQRSVDELEKLAKEIAPMSYDSGLREARPSLQTASRRKSSETLTAGDSKRTGRTGRSHRRCSH